MRAHLLYFVIAFASGFAASVSACAASSASPSDNGNTTYAADGGPGCTLCVTDKDCNGGICAQFGGDSYCAAACPNGNECSAGYDCAPVSTVEGDQKSVCIPRAGTCGSAADGGGGGGGGGGRGGGGGGGCGSNPPPLADTCGSLNGPSVTSKCNSCGTKTCQANGCYGGWWCNTTTNKCQAPPSPSSCPAPSGSTCDAGSGSVHIDAGGPVNGTVGPNGGTVSRLFFAVVGDTRPPVINDTSAYPTAVITKIWQDIEASSPKPPFALSTGDYLFSSANGSEAAPQLDMYLQARAKYSGMTFPAMGNHECTGGVTSNCGPGNADGMTVNYQTFVTKMLTPIGKTSPNYSVNINAADSSWTAKFVFVAGNSWGSGEAAWLDGVMAQPTTYTFVIRHEPRAASSPGTGASEQIMAQHPYTLAIVGHTHTYGKTGPKQVTIGNGGAPLTGGANYGYGIISQRSDGAIQVDMIDSSTGQPDLGFRFALHPDGTPAP